MKKLLTIFSVLMVSLAQAQESNYQYKMGINTEYPRATLEIKAAPISALPAGTPQGVLFPRFKSNEREKFVAVKEGTMIFNIDKKCLEIYIQNNWKCVAGN